MKELTIEQKAQRYDEVIEKLHDFYRDYDTVSCLIDVKEELANLFPELKESEDEKMRKGIIRNLEYLMDRAEGFVKDELKERIAWLEKQGEHANFRNKIQIGDKVTRNEDGVLVNLSQLNRVAKKQSEQKPAKNKGMNLKEEEMTPFQKEVFYIIDTNIEAEVGLKQECDILLALASNEIKQHHAWSEEDERMLGAAYDLVTTTPRYMANKSISKENVITWLKSLKDRVQPKQEWSEEDEANLNEALSYIKDEALKEFVKSLRPWYTWKPSQEMLDALCRAVPDNVKEMSEDEMLLDKLYQGLRYGRVLSAL